MRQDPFQCYISFIASSNSNLQNIKSSLRNITKKFGIKVKFNNKEFYTFPEPKKLAKATKQELFSCGLGYRAPFVMRASNLVSTSQIDFNYLKKTNYLTEIGRAHV